MIGSLNWVGKSSLEISVDIYDESERVLESTFCMVAKDSTTGKPCSVNPLIPESEEEKAVFALGASNKARRSEARSKSLKILPPSPEESTLLHDIFMNKKHTIEHRTIRETNCESLTLCRGSSKNLHNTIFGGYLMRKSYHMAFSTAFLYLKHVPEFVSFDEITFLRPMYVGDALQMISDVIYTNGQYLHIEVISAVINPVTSETKTTNIFNFMFKSNTNVIPVFPETYPECMRYLEARRHHFEN